ncbi:MAG: ABC transporter substrate-binding protein [Anaerolineae bacterium]
MRAFRTLSLLLLVVALLAGCAGATPEAAPTETKTLILATTTSTDDSGLLKVILPDFTARTGITAEVVAVGTGQAIELGQNCDADVLLVHARFREDAYMEAGYGTRREDVMYNDFVVLGPESDPAGIAGMTDAAAAFARIAETGSTFISRGDDSGTHTKELSVWKAAAIEPAGDWYVSAGQGMNDVLTMAEEQLGYSLSDRATYLSRTKEGYTLKVLVEGDKVLFNPYGVMDVNPAKCPDAKADYAQQFIDWITSAETKELIGSFGVAEFGAPLFTPQ